MKKSMICLVLALTPLASQADFGPNEKFDAREIVGAKVIVSDEVNEGLKCVTYRQNSYMDTQTISVVPGHCPEPEKGKNCREKRELKKIYSVERIFVSKDVTPVVILKGGTEVALKTERFTVNQSDINANWYTNPLSHFSEKVLDIVKESNTLHFSSPNHDNGFCYYVGMKKTLNNGQPEHAVIWADCKTGMANLNVVMPD